ncbi:hypothetical protein COCNU_scaffold001933G000020 [Cocos nucifera]|nr:hypothetical protein [Cocos nucifera]
MPTDRIIVVEGESPPSELANLPSEDCMPDPLTDKEKKRRKEKAAIVKKACKMCPNEPDRGSNEDQGVDPFDNPDIIWDLIDSFALPEEVDCLANLDQSDLFMVVGPPHACPPQAGKSLRC